MAAFVYSAINAKGMEFDGTIAAADLAGAMEQLRAKGLLPQRIDRVDDERASASAGAFKYVKPKSLQIFSRQFATMIEAGMNVVIVARHPRAADERQGARRP